MVKWASYELIKFIEWQELPEIQHDTVKLGAALDILHPTWAEECSFPNFAGEK